jgi:hypothetical protein
LKEEEDFESVPTISFRRKDLPIRTPVCATVHVKRNESPPTVETPYRIVNVFHHQERCLCNDIDINMRIHTPINPRGSAARRSEKKRKRRSDSRHALRIGSDGTGNGWTRTMRMNRNGVGARVSSCVIDSFGLKADGKQRTLFWREADFVLLCFSFGCGFFDGSFVNINHQGHTISSSMA